MARRLALAVVAVAAVAVFASGAFGFTGVTAERGVSVAVVDDESAFLGLPNDPPTVDCEVTSDESSCAVALVDVTNRFATDLTAVSVTSSNDAVDPSSPDRIGVGETATVEASVACDPGPNEPTKVETTLDISVSGDGVEATRYDKSVTVTCTNPNGRSSGGTGVLFDGCGNVGLPAGYEVDRYVVHNNGQNEFDLRDKKGGGTLVGVVTVNNGSFANGNFFESNGGELEYDGGCSKGNGEGIDATGDPPWESASETATPTATATETGS